MVSGINWIIDRFRFYKSQSGKISNGVPEYISSGPVRNVTATTVPPPSPSNFIRIKGSFYNLSGPTELITQAFRSNSTPPLIPLRASLGDIYSNITKKPWIIASSTEEAGAYADRLYSLQKGILRLNCQLSFGTSNLSEESIDDLIHLERKAKWLSARMTNVEQWEYYVLPRDRQLPYILRRNYLRALLSHAERSMLRLGVFSKERLPLLPQVAQVIPKKDFFLPIRGFANRFSSLFIEAKEVVKDQCYFFLKDVKENPIMIGLAVITAIALVGAVTYWAAERESVHSFYDQ